MQAKPHKSPLGTNTENIKLSQLKVSRAITASGSHLTSGFIVRCETISGNHNPE